MNNTSINFQEFLNKEVTVYYEADKEVQGILSDTSDLGITVQLSKIKDKDVLSFQSFNNTIFIPFSSINDLKSGLCMIEDEEVLDAYIGATGQ